MVKMEKKDQNRIVQDFRALQSRQFIAIAAALFLVLLAAVIHQRPDLFGEFSNSILYGAQVVVIAAFIVYTGLNWRCPSCSRYLSNDINRSICKKCGAKLR
jgi:hypothetical protein